MPQIPSQPSDSQRVTQKQEELPKKQDIPAHHKHEGHISHRQERQLAKEMKNMEALKRLTKDTKSLVDQVKKALEEKDFGKLKELEEKLSDLKEEIGQVQADAAQMKISGGGEEGELEAIEKLGGLTPSDFKQVASQLTDLIMRTVETLSVGEKGVMMNLKPEAAPSFFKEATVNIQVVEPGRIEINIAGLSPQDQNIAVKAIQQNAAELAKMVENLASKNTHISQMTIGNEKIALPTVETQTARPIDLGASEGGRREREGQREGGGQGRGGGEEREGREGERRNR